MKRLLFFILFCSLFNINLSAENSSASSPDKADTLYREWSSSRGATKTEIANRLMKTFFDEQDMDTLMVFSKQSQARQNASVMTYMTNHLFYQSRFDEAYQLGVDALLESENIGEVSLISECLNTLGIICQRKGLFEQALSYMKRVYALDKQWGSPEDMSTTMNNLATLYLGVDDPETALSYVLPSIAYERESGDGARLAIRLGLASDIWLSLGHPEKALEFIDEALGIDLREGRTVKAAVRRSQRTSVLSALGRYKEARACLDSAVTVLEQESNHISLAICYNLRGGLDMKEKHFADAVTAMKDRKKAEFISEVAEEIEGLDSDKETGVPKLTNREMEIVRMCCEGLSSKEIAAQMELSVRTVDTHKANIFRKLKIKSTVELVKYVAETGLLG